MLINLLIILLFGISCECWQYFTTIQDWTLTNSQKDRDVVHSEYYFGRCRKESGYVYYTHIHFDHMEVLGKIIMRGWLDIPRIPTCIILRARSYPQDTFRATSYNFQFCVPRISYCHAHFRWKYHYYEWYIPTDMVGGMNWDIYFFGPPTVAW